MKKIIAIIAALVVVGATTAMAAGPETIELDKTGNKGKIAFPHKKHQEALKISCKDCHSGAPGKIEGFKGMGAGHKLCKDCHSKKNPDTAKCEFCHKK